MISKLKGILDSHEQGQIVLDVNGVGYALYCSTQTGQSLPSEGGACTLYVEPLIRAEHISLFGFSTPEERALFRVMLTVQGVGGKVCMALLSALDPQTLRESIETQDHVPLTQADGIGPKVAQRIVRELKDKMGSMSFAGSLKPTAVKGTNKLQQEAVSALVNLGYKKGDAVVAVDKALKDGTPDLTLNQLIPLALKELTSA